MSSITAEIYELIAPEQLVLSTHSLTVNSCGPYELIAETIYSAISPGTETAAFAGAEPLRPGKVYPRVVGYCNVARVIFTGNGVTKFATGDIILTFQSHRSVFKIYETEFALKLNTGINPKHAVTAYLFHLGYHGLLTADARSGHNVGVIGAGVLGYTASVMSRVIGARTYAFTNQPGATESLKNESILVFTKNESCLPEISETTHGTGLDIIINTSNSWSDWKLALQLANKGGIIVNLGFPGRNQKLPEFNPLDPQFVYTKNLTIKALCPITETDIPAHEIRHNMKRNLEYILDLIAEKRIHPQNIISGETGYQNLESAYRKYLKKDASLFTTLLNWEKH